MSKAFSLQCPLPDNGVDHITLAHGSGGRAAEWLLENYIIPSLDNKWLVERGDGAVLDWSGPLAFSTDSFVVSPIFFPGGNIGELAVNGTVNDLAMCGALPRFISLSLILEEGFPLARLWEIMQSMAKACEEADVRVVTGDTKVVERGKGDGVYINTTGVGILHPKATLGANRVKAGDVILLSGPLARHGMAVMSRRKGLEFETAITSDTRPLNSICSQLLDRFGEDIHFFRDPTRGGVATVLHELAVSARLGVDIHTEKLPLEEEVAGACEMLGLDPLYVANEGLFIAVVDAVVADEALQVIRSWHHGGQADMIGNISQEHPGKVILHNRYGGKRWLLPLSGEQLPRIC